MTSDKGDAFVIVAEFEVHPDKMDRFLELVREDARLSVQNEPGCSQFDVTVQEDAPNRVLLYEFYDDAAAFDAHMQTPHLKAFIGQIDDLLLNRRVRRLRRIKA
jgi:quinol monooxygenase YgiN